MQRFVLLSNARSGSNMLQSMLDKHPQIVCYGEVFNPMYGKGYVKWVKKSFLRRLAEKYIRDFCVENYLNTLSDVPSSGITGRRMISRLSDCIGVTCSEGIFRQRLPTRRTVGVQRNTEENR